MVGGGPGSRSPNDVSYGLAVPPTISAPTSSSQTTQTDDMPRLVPWAGLAAMLGGLLGIVYFPLHAAAFFATSTEPESEWVIAWSDAFRGLAVPLFTFASPDDVHTTYARLAVFVLMGFTVGLVALHSRQSAVAGRVERWGFRITLVAMVAFVASVIADFWLGGFDWVFLVLEVPALLLLMVGSPLFGIGTLRAGLAPRLGAWLLATGAFPGMFLLIFATGHLSGGLLMLDLA